MKKILCILGILAAVTASVCAAGCLDEQTERITGTWYYQNDTTAAELIFGSTGNGIFSLYAVTEKEDGTPEYTGTETGVFSWIPLENNRYLLSYLDGTDEEGFLNPAHDEFLLGDYLLYRYTDTEEPENRIF